MPKVIRQLSDHLCECGCGEFTRLMPWSNATEGLVRGQPMRFVHGHNARLQRGSKPRKPIVRNRTDGFCECGCGEKTVVPTASALSQGRVKGVPMRFVHNHHARLQGHKSGFPNGVLVDPEFEYLAHEYSWYLHNKYVVGRKIIEGKVYRAYLHRLVLGVTSDRADHINRNRLDNRRCNLRIATQAENGQNLGIRSDNRSGYRGVRWDGKRWLAQATIKGEVVFRARFSSKEEANEAVKAFRAANMPFSQEALRERN
jgi:hypothetical protein